jgi:hypothetical protein
MNRAPAKTATHAQGIYSDVRRLDAKHVLGNLFHLARKLAAHPNFELVRSTLEELRGQGRLRSVNTTVAAFSLLGMVMWIARWYSAEGPLSREQVAEDIASIALSAVLTGTKPQEIRPFENPS